MECDMKMDRSDITQISLQKLNWLFIPTSSVKTSDSPFNQTQLPSIRSYNINLFLKISGMISSVKKKGRFHTNSSDLLVAQF